MSRRYLRFTLAQHPADEIRGPHGSPGIVHTRKDFASLRFSAYQINRRANHIQPYLASNAVMNGIIRGPDAPTSHGHKVAAEPALFEDVSGKAVLALLNEDYQFLIYASTDIQRD